MVDVLDRKGRLASSLSGWSHTSIYNMRNLVVYLKDDNGTTLTLSATQTDSIGNY